MASSAGAAQGLEARLEDVAAREAAVATAQGALLKAEDMLRKVTESALQEKAEYQAAARAASREADLLYKAECAARAAAEERAVAAEAALAATQAGGGQASSPRLGSCTQTWLPCIAGVVIGAMLVAK